MDDITESENALHTSPKHKRSAAKIEPLFAAYVESIGAQSEPTFTSLGDMLTDVFHFATEQGFDPREVVERAFTHFDAETPHQSYHLGRAIEIWQDENRDDPANHNYAGEIGSASDRCTVCGDNEAGLLHAFDPRFGDDYFSEVILDAFEKTKE